MGKNTIIIKKFSRKASFLAILGFFVFTLILIMGFLGYQKVFAPGPLKLPKTLIIPHGMSTSKIASTLAEQGVIDSPNVFHVLSRIKHSPLKAGEYIFYPWINLWNTLKILNEGQVVVHKFRVPEGRTSFQIVDQLNKTEPLSGFIIEIPPEGTLLPNTYFFQYGEDRQDLLKRMAKAMEETLKTLWASRDPDVPLATPFEAVILASIVEKEAMKSNERSRIAGVFFNRLKKGMLLQSDPTVIYGMTKGRQSFLRNLSKQDLKKETSHNTYALIGLPPTPICNPGHAALWAVLHPLKTEELFFVANGQGGHHFSKNYKDHAHHHSAWRQIRKSLQSASKN